MKGRYIISVDQSTSASKVLLIDEEGNILRRASRNHHQSFPQPGWAEHDGQEILANVLLCVEQVMEGIGPDQAAALAISN